MISTVQTYQLNNREVEVDLTQVPELSLKSQCVLRDIPFPSAFATGLEAHDIQIIKNMPKEIQETKENSTKIKIIALLKTALIVSLAAVFILASLFFAPAVLVIAIVYAAISCLFAGLILFEGLTRESSLEAHYEKQKERIRMNVALAKIHNDRILPEVYSFYRDKTESIIQYLDQTIQRVMEQDRSRSLFYLNDLRDARNEIMQIAQFYRQFDPIPV